MTIDIDSTTYHEVGDRIWRIDSGTDYGDVWDPDVFEQHGEDYLDEDDYDGEGFGDDIVRDAEGEIEKLEVDFGDRGYSFSATRKQMISGCFSTWSLIQMWTIRSRT